MKTQLGMKLPEHPGRRRLLGAGLGACALGGLPAWAQASGTRVAVVIGNAAYASAPLANPGNDARVMAAALRQMGFEIVEARDASRAQMQAAIQAAGAKLAGRAGIGLLYYAGHGLQLDWRNYMLPVDARLTQPADVPAQAVDVQSVLGTFSAAGCRMNILVLDACRNNPFGQASSARGLAPMDAPPGTFFAYATAPGNVAEDGSAQDGNGLYTRFLVQELQRQDARIEDVFKRVRLQVRQASQGRQIPWESTSLEDDFVFATGHRVEPTAATRRDAEFDAEKAEWDRIKASTRPEDFYEFLKRYPSGRITELAQFRLDQLAKPVVQAVQTVRVLPSGVDRFRVGDSWAMRRTDFLAGGSAVDIRQRVTAIENGRVIINGGDMVVDQMGGILVNRFGVKDPALMSAPADLQVGKRWRSAFTNTRPGGPLARSYYEHRVVALEDIEVPAGRFKAFKIEAAGEGVLPRKSLKLRYASWIDPATMSLVRQDMHQSTDGGAEIIEHSSAVLLWRKQVPRG